MVLIKFLGALVFVIGISLVFYTSEKYIFDSSRHIFTDKHKIIPKQFKFRITNLFNEGVPNAIVYISLDSPTHDYNEVHITNKIGETTFPNVPTGKYFWKVVLGDSTLICARGTTDYPLNTNKENCISVCMEKAQGNFSKLSLSRCKERK